MIHVRGRASRGKNQQADKPVALPRVNHFRVGNVAAGGGTVEKVEEEPNGWRQRVINT
jgi:hypothetical protein